MNKNIKKSGNVKPKKIEEEKEKDKNKEQYSFKENEIKKAEFIKEARLSYPDLKQKWDKLRKNKRIKTTPAKLKHKLMRLAKFKDLELISIIHITLDGRAFLVPAILEDNNLYYQAEKEHFKSVDEGTTFNWYDGFKEKGFFCHSILPETFIPSSDIDKQILMKCKELDYHKKMLKKTTILSDVLDLSDSQKKVAKYVFIIGVVGGFGAGVFAGFWLIAGMM